MEPAQTEERDRRANDIGRPPTDPANRITITLQPPPHNEHFPDKEIVKVIGHNCMDGWPVAVVTWAEAPQQQKTRAWEDFKLRFTWDASIDAKVKEIYAMKCTERTKGMFNTARSTALKHAEKAHPGHAHEHMQDFPPWWCECRIWAEMCQTWRGDGWAKKSRVASANRASGTPSGQRAMGTYMGGTKSQVQYMKEAQTQSEGGSQRTWTELYQSLRNNLPGADEPCSQYDQLMAEKYPDASSCPNFDQNLWVTASGGAKKGYVKGLGFKRSRPTNFTTCTTASSSSVGGSTTTSAAPTSQQAAQEMVTALCSDQNLLRSLKDALLSTMSVEEIGVYLDGRAQSQGSSNTEPPPPPPAGNEGFELPPPPPPAAGNEGFELQPPPPPPPPRNKGN